MLQPAPLPRHPAQRGQKRGQRDVLINPPVSQVERPADQERLDLFRDARLVGRNLVNMLRHQQQRFPILYVGTNEVQIVKRHLQIESARRFVKYEHRRLMH